MSEKHYQCEPNAACEHGHQMKHFSMPNSPEAVARKIVDQVTPAITSYGFDENRDYLQHLITTALTTFAAQQVAQADEIRALRQQLHNRSAHAEFCHLSFCPGPIGIGAEVSGCNPDRSEHSCTCLPAFEKRLVQVRREIWEEAAGMADNLGKGGHYHFPTLAEEFRRRAQEGRG